VCGSDTATLFRLHYAMMQNSQILYMADSYLFDIPTKAGDDLGFLVRDRRRC
jgi:hypothetical protein